MSTENEQKAKIERFNRLRTAFAKAIVDRLADVAKENGGVYVPSTDALKAAAFDAMNEVVESEIEPVSPMMAVGIWEAELKINESAHRQGLMRAEKAGLLAFKIAAGEKKVESIAAKYL